MEHITNQALLRGILAEPPVFSHENHGKQFCRFTLEVARLSGTVDTLPIMAPQILVQELMDMTGVSLRVSGTIRSYNQRTEQGRHLRIFLFADSVIPEEGESINQVFLQGQLCREPVYRRTPLGREICDIMLAVNRAFRRSDYLPCILWGRTAQLASQCHVGDGLSITGRLQSRLYTKLTPEGPIQKTAYEISALSADVISDQIEPV